jgi:hypothetical protein
VDAARQHFEKALKLFGVASYQLGKAILLMSLGDLELSLDDVDLARLHFEDALPLYEAVCSRLGEVNVHMSDFLSLDWVVWMRPASMSRTCYNRYRARAI